MRILRVGTFRKLFQAHLGAQVSVRTNAAAGGKARTSGKFHTANDRIELPSEKVEWAAASAAQSAFATQSIGYFADKMERGWFGHES